MLPEKDISELINDLEYNLQRRDEEYSKLKDVLEMLKRC